MVNVSAQIRHTADLLHSIPSMSSDSWSCLSAIDNNLTGLVHVGEELSCFTALLYADSPLSSMRPTTIPECRGSSNRECTDKWQPYRSTFITLWRYPSLCSFITKYSTNPNHAELFWCPTSARSLYTSLQLNLHSTLRALSLPQFGHHVGTRSWWHPGSDKRVLWHMHTHVNTVTYFTLARVPAL